MTATPRAYRRLADATTAADPTWRQRAACAGLAYTYVTEEGHAADPWFPAPSRGGMDGYHQARQICRGCSVVAECLAFALDNDIRDGLWGAKSADERQPLHRAYNAARRAS